MRIFKKLTKVDRIIFLALIFWLAFSFVYFEIIERNSDLLEISFLLSPFIAFILAIGIKWIYAAEKLK